MAYRILVPLDGSILADRAIPLADQLAAALAAEVEMVMVVPPGATNPREPALPFLYSDLPEGAEAKRALSVAAPWFVKAPSVRAAVLEGEPGVVIARHAKESGADLIIMASHGRGGLQRALLGSVAEQTIEESQVPVLVIRAEVADPLRLPRRVLVPLDGSLKSATILQGLRPLAHALGWELTLFSVVPQSPKAPGVEDGEPAGSLQATRWADAIAFLSPLAARLREHGVEAQVEARRGEPAPTIAEFARTGGYDLVAMSTRGLYDRHWLANGSVTHYVGAHARVPILAIRPHRVPTEGEIDLWLRKSGSAPGPSIHRGLVERAEIEQKRWTACCQGGVREGVHAAAGAHAK